MYSKYHIKVNNERVAYFEYPTQKELKGIILFCHGFPGANRLTVMAQPLNEQGYTLEEINYRGDQESEGTFSFFGSIEDITALVEHLRKKYPNLPLTGLGFSAGGFYILNAVRKQPRLFDKIVLLNPLLDVEFLKTPIMDMLWEEAQQALRLKPVSFYKTEIDTVLVQYNPLQFAPELEPIISIVQADQDSVLAPATAEEFFNKLKHPGTLSWIHDADHNVAGNEPELINTLINN